MEDPVIQEIIGELKAVLQTPVPDIDEPTACEPDEQILKVYIKVMDTHGAWMLIKAIEKAAAESEMHRMVLAQYDVLVEGLLDCGREEDAQTVVRLLLISESTDVRIPLTLTELMFRNGNFPYVLVEGCVEKARRLLSDLESHGGTEALAPSIQLAYVAKQPADLRRAIRLFNKADADTQERMAMSLQDAFVTWEEKIEAQRFVAKIASDKWRDELSRALHTKKRSHS